MATAARLLLLLFLTAAASAWEMNIRLPTERLAYGGGEAVVAPLIHALRPLLGSGGQLAARAGVACDSWRLAVEAHNLRGLRRPLHARRPLPPRLTVVVDEAIAYVDSLKLAGNGKEIWVFDIDETSLSNLPYFAKHGFGTTLYDDTCFREYVEGSGLALPETRRLYRRLLQLGVKPVFLTSRTEDERNITVTNLRRQGYSGWMKLLLKPAVHTAGELLGSVVAFKSGERQKLEDAGFTIVGNIGDQWSDILVYDSPIYIRRFKPAVHTAGELLGSVVAFKSGERQKLEDAGFTIVGNIGDQWSNILGAPEGARTFKLPDPLYYIG
uniref:Acid phosphatase n=1 Tax=Oryza rufipogon TaxID=4529 RepID=A0A0E0PIJ6_ORYRU